MLSSLSIKNVVLIEALSLDFSHGLTALTGETGAGKSIILDSLGMATGARSDRGLVRAGTETAQCIATFDMPVDHPVRQILEEAGVEVDPQEALILRRQVNKDGRSRAFVNDEPVSVKLLSDIGTVLLEVHGQHDGRGLMDVLTHIDMLDQFSGNGACLAKCETAFTDWAAAKADVQKLEAQRAKSAEDREFLEHAIAEIDRLDPKPGEDEALASERKFLQGAEGALTELSAAEDALGEDGAFEQRLATALNGIERIQNKMPDTDGPARIALVSAAEALERAMLETQEARAAVSQAASCFDVEPGRLEAAEKRLFELRAAARKYNVEIDKLIELRAEFAEKLGDIGNVDKRLDAAKRAAKESEATYFDIAKDLSARRMAASDTLSQSVMSELPPLKMERAQFIVACSEAPPSARGIDRVAFLVSTNPGTPIGPLEKIASGGEMARFALAIKVALAGKNDAVMVFDEVDQGVGGAVADAVGRRLARLADKGQVFVVTHSAQVAACADHQFRIEKSSDESVTKTEVFVIDAEGREEEIARMLAGETITNEARAAARQLMQSR